MTKSVDAIRTQLTDLRKQRAAAEAAFKSACAALESAETEAAAKRSRTTLIPDEGKPLDPDVSVKALQDRVAELRQRIKQLDTEESEAAQALKAELENSVTEIARRVRKADQEQRRSLGKFGARVFKDYRAIAERSDDIRRDIERLTHLAGLLKAGQDVRSRRQAREQLGALTDYLGTPWVEEATFDEMLGFLVSEMCDWARSPSTPLRWREKGLDERPVASILHTRPISEAEIHALRAGRLPIRRRVS